MTRKIFKSIIFGGSEGPVRRWVLAPGIDLPALSANGIIGVNDATNIDFSKNVRSGPSKERVVNVVCL